MQVELFLSFASARALQIDLMIFDAAWEIANHARWHHLFFSPALLFIPIPKILVLEGKCTRNHSEKMYHGLPAGDMYMMCTNIDMCI